MNSDKIYAIMFSAHGSLFRFDRIVDGVPVLFTKKSAIRQAKRWDSIADTVGGQARVINMWNGEIIDHHERKERKSKKNYIHQPRCHCGRS